jgi:hypothetical protein
VSGSSYQVGAYDIKHGYDVREFVEAYYLPKLLRLKYEGEPRWKGKQGRLEIIYDEVDEVWRGFKVYPKRRL